MKLALVFMSLVLLASCSRPKMLGHVTDDLRVDFGNDVIGTCVFDNTPHPGDLVTVSDETGKCHAEPK